MTMGTPPSSGADFGAPPGTPGMAAPAPAKRKFPVWAIVLIVIVLLCICVVCVVGGLMLSNPTIMGPAMAGAQLPTICVEQSGLSQQACGTWAQGVTSNPAFSTCVTEGMEAGSITGQSLYDCLVANGAGPQ